MISKERARATIIFSLQTIAELGISCGKCKYCTTEIYDKDLEPCCSCILKGSILINFEKKEGR